MKISGMRLAACRARLGLSQQELAEKAGYSIRSIQGWEGGETGIHPQKLRKLAEVLQQPTEYLMGENLPPAAREDSPPYRIQPDSYGAIHAHIESAKRHLAEMLTAHAEASHELAILQHELRKRWPNANSAPPDGAAELLDAAEESDRRSHPQSK